MFSVKFKSISNFVFCRRPCCVNDTSVYRQAIYNIGESHVIETRTGERKIQIQNAHFIFMHVPHNLSDHSGPLSQTIPIFCKRPSKLSCPTVGLSKFTIETDFHVSPYVTFKEALQQRQNSFTCSAFFCV
jgi:hypothetical protein